MHLNIVADYIFNRSYYS